MFLGEWYIDVVYSKTETVDSPYAECKCSPMYLEATIIIYPAFWCQVRSRWEHVIVHELAHCTTGQVQRMLEDALNSRLHPAKEVDLHVEQLTQRIANIAYWGPK